MEKDEKLRGGVPSAAFLDSGAAMHVAYGSTPAPRTVAIDFGQVVS